MMKKIFSMILACAMIMSLFCAVPAGATDFILPYIGVDFEDMADNAESNYSDSYTTWNSRTYIEGVSGGKALYKNGTGTSGSDYISVTFSEGKSPATMVTGKDFKISFWLKLNTEISKFASDTTPSRLQLCYTANGGAKGYKEYNFNAQTAALNTGDWVYYEQTFDAWDGKFGSYDTVENPDNASLAMTFRLGYTNGVAPNGNNTDTYPSLMDPAKNRYAIAIDEFRIEPIIDTFDPDNIVEEEYVPKTVVEYKFDQNSANVVEGGTAHWNCQSATKSIVSSGGADNGKYAKITWSTSTGNAWRDLTWTHNQEMDKNKLTKITFWAKAEDTNTVGAQLRWRLYQKANSGSPAKLDLDANVNKTDLFPDDYWYIEVGTLTASWKEYTVYLKNNAKTFDESKYRISLQVKHPNTGFSFGIDNLKITQEEIPTNCGFENLGYAPANTVKSDGTVLANEQSKKYATNLYGWLADGATVTASTTEKYEGSQAAKVVTTAADGSIYQGIYLENNKAYEISFWAKGEGDSIGKNISVILDREVATKSEYDVYPVANVETLTPADAVLTDSWKKFTVNYTLNSATPETMPTINAGQEIGVRQPFLKFSVDNGASGMTYYLDNLKIAAPREPNAEPFIKNYDMFEKDGVTPAVPVDCKPVCIKYTAITELENDPVAAVVARIMVESKAGSDKYGTCATFVDETASGSIDFKIPEGLVGRKIKISLQPFSENGVIGAHYEKVIGEIQKQYEATMSVGSYDVSTSSITTTYSVLNNKIDNSDVRAIMAIIFYAEDGTMVKCETKPVVVSVGNSLSNEAFTATSTLSDTSLPAATKAKVYFWFTEGNSTPSVFNTTMEEVVPSETVNFN